MQYNDTTTLTGLLQDCETLTGLGNGNISGNTARKQEFTRLLNAEGQLILEWAATASGTWQFDDTNKTDLPSFLSTLVAGQSDYSLPVVTGTATSGAALEVYRIEVLDSNSQWINLKKIDANQVGVALPEFMDTDGIPQYYDLRGNSFFLYPAPSASQMTLTNGCRIYIRRELYEFTTSDTTKEPPFPRGFHRLYSLGASIAWLSGNTKDFSLVDRYQIEREKLKRDLQRYYGRRHGNAPDRITPRMETYQ